jgi:hypothetical protein
MIFDISQFNRVGECLYRIHAGGYYALIKVGGKQIKRSLRTHDQALAKRRRKELREKATESGKESCGRPRTNSQKKERPDR